MTEDEIREIMKQHKVDHPEIDWEVHDVYAVVETETQKLERIGIIRKDRLLSMNLEGQNR